MRIVMKRAQCLYQIPVVLAVTMLFSSASLAADGQQSEQAKSSTATNQGAVRKLEVGKPIERELKGGESHSYEISLEAGHFLNALVEQRGIDVVVQVIAPNGRQLLEVDSPNGTQGDEPVTLITEAAGVYRLNVASLEKDAPAGKYEIRVKELRVPTVEDRALIEKNRVLQEATKLNQEVERLYGAGKYEAARPLAERALAIREKVLGAEHTDTAESLNNLAELYEAKGDYAKAEPLLIRALVINEKARGAQHLVTAYSLNNLAAMYNSTGDYVKAEPLLIRALAISEKVLGAEHPNTAISLGNLAFLYDSKGDYAKAELLEIRALGIKEKALGAEHPDTAHSLNNLANLYDSKGDYAKAEPLFIRALAIREKALGAEHPDTANSLDDLAALYNSKGDSAKAEPLLIRALAIREKALGAEHPDTALSLNNLAFLYYSKGDYARAEPFWIRALAIKEKTLGPEHTGTALSLNNLAELYQARGDYAKAEALYLRALAINEKVLGAEHRSTALSLNNLAALYYSKGDYAKAEPLYLRALAIREKTLGAEHPSTALSLNHLAVLYRTKGDYAKAIDFQSGCNDSSDRDLVRNLASGSERQKLTYLNQTSSYTDSTISLHVQSAPNDVNAKRAALKVLLQRKGRALDAMTDAIATLRRRVSPQDQQLLNQLQDVRSQLSVLTLRGPGRIGLEKHKANLKGLEEQEEKLQNDISQRSAEFRAQSHTESKPVTIEVIQKAIPEGAALIEFAQYRPTDPREADKEKRFGKPRYVAYVLRNQGEPSWVELGEAKTVDDKIAAFRQALRAKRNGNVTRLARTVDAAVMQPVRKLVGKTRRVFLSPDSALNLIPFAALVDERHQYLVKRYSFTYLTSGRDLLRLQTKVQGKTAKVVIADPDFGKVTTTASSDRDRGALDDLYFPPLKATEAEARDLQRLFPDAMVLTKEQATEAALKAVDRPAILHIATHGFFLNDEQQLDSQAEGEKTRIVVRRKDKPQVKGESDASQLVNPLLRSGLGLAGANQRTGSDGNDGILTALEAAGIDLWGTKLVVLSACDTGVGKVVNGDGVYGLRRALVLAGSESQMMSLWPVSDTGTRELMIEYYRRLKAGEGRSEALRRVQLKMLASKNRNHPFYWASFIQSGEWANLDGKRID